MTDSTVPAFYAPLSAGPRPWGTEDLVALVPGVATCKLLKVKAGSKGRLQKHHVKDEAGHLLEGRMMVRYANESGDGLTERAIEAGESYHFPPGLIHQEEALTDCVVVEVSTPHGNDREGAEDQFGLEVPADALPTTAPEEVVVWEKWW